MSLKNPLTCALLVLVGALALLWLVHGWHRDTEEDLQRALRQYGEVRSLIVQYDGLRRSARPAPSRTEAKSLFSAINEKSAELSLTGCIESLRPSTSQEQGTELLDVQMRGLYLGEAMRWLQAVESLPDVRIDNLNLRRTDKRLLDLDMRLVRSRGTPDASGGRARGGGA